MGLSSIRRVSASGEATLWSSCSAVSSHFLPCPEAAQNLHSAALLFDLLAALTDETVRMAILEGGVLTPSGIRYAQRAVQYIVAHLSKKITMDELGRGTRHLLAI